MNRYDFLYIRFTFSQGPLDAHLQGHRRARTSSTGALKTNAHNSSIFVNLYQLNVAAIGLHILSQVLNVLADSRGQRFCLGRTRPFCSPQIRFLSLSNFIKNYTVDWPINKICAGRICS